MPCTSRPRGRSAGRRCARALRWASPCTAASTRTSTATCSTTARAGSGARSPRICADFTTRPPAPWCRRRACAPSSRRSASSAWACSAAASTRAGSRRPAARRRSARAWGASDGDLVALYVGRLAPEKNVGLAVAAYRAMQQARGDALRFVVVGDGPLGRRSSAAHPDLVFRGFRTGEDLAAHYASADVFLFPSETETFGNVTLEAMASGLAVVAYDYAAARMHIEDGVTGALARPGDAARLRRRRGDAGARARDPAGAAPSGARGDGGRGLGASGGALREAPVWATRRRGGRTCRTTCSGSFWVCVSPPRP